MGTYGIVYKAKCKQTGNIFALKQIKMHLQQQNEGFPVTSLREICLLKQLKHENIIELNSVLVGANKESVFLCFEYCQIDLANLVNRMYESSLLQNRSKRE